MQEQILQEKLNPPVVFEPIRKENFFREITRALEIEGGFYRKFTLITAPAGYGKTTMLVDFFNSLKREKCWLTFSAEDNLIDRLTTHLLASVSGIFTEEDKLKTKKFLQNPGSFSEEAEIESGRRILAEVLQEISRKDIYLYLFLDELEQIKSRSSLDLLQFFLENLPANMHVIAASREEPDWPLIRWTARGKAKIIGQEELKFKPDEVQDFMARSKIELSREEAETLARITEGWVTGLQLISLLPDFSLDKFTSSSFSGPKRKIMDFLLEEVLAQQEEEIREFLLQTAPLSRFNASLCGAVTNFDKIGELLDLIHKKQLFLKMIDSEGNWYRYHQLFAAALSSRLEAENPALKKNIHKLAAEWYCEQGLFKEAVEEALNGEKYDWAAALIFKNSGQFMRQGLRASMMSWLERFPRKILRQQPGLQVVQAILELFKGHLLTAENKLTQIQAEREAGNFRELAEKDRIFLEGMIAVGFLVLTVFQGQRAEIGKYTEEALEKLSRGNYWRQIAMIYHADDQLFSGDLEGALQSYQTARFNEGPDSYGFFVQLAGLKEAWQLWWMGRLDEAAALCDSLLEKAEDAGFSYSPRAGTIRAIRGDLYCEENELERARELIETALEINRLGGEVIGQLLVGMYQLRYLFTIRDFPRARETLERLQILSQEESFDLVIDILTGWKVRFWLEPEYPDRQDWIRAVNLLASRGIKPENKPGFAQEMEYLALSRAYICGGRLKEAERIINYVLELSRENRVVRRELESRLLLVHLREEEGERAQALKELRKALDLARKEGFFRSILDEGELVTCLLQELLPDEERKFFISRLLSSLDLGGDVAEQDDKGNVAGQEHRGDIAELKDRSGTAKMERSGRQRRDSSGDGTGRGRSAAGTAGSSAGKEEELIEPLSERELEILIEIAAGFANKEIADRLNIANGTVRWHTSNIYGKLGVDNRTRAVARAHQLGLLD